MAKNSNIWWEIVELFIAFKFAWKVTNTLILNCLLLYVTLPTLVLVKKQKSIYYKFNYIISHGYIKA